MVWDEGTGAARGLHVLVSPAGAKTYRSIFYFPGSAKPHSRKLGRVGELSLAEARAGCREDRAKAARGEDPRSSDPARSDSFKAGVETYVAHEQIGTKGNVTAREAQRVMLKACPDWHGGPIATIRPQEIQHRLWQIRDGNPDAGIRPKPYLANKAYTHLKAFFSWCAKPGIGLLNVSPMIGIDKPWKGEAPRDRVFSDDELRRLWNCKLDPQEAAFLKLLILTGKRKGALVASVA